MIITVFLRFPCSISGDYVGCNFPGMLLLVGKKFPTHGACFEDADRRAYPSHGACEDSFARVLSYVTTVT